MDLFVGLLNGKLLMIDLQSMSPLAVFNCHEDRVKPLFSLKVSFMLSICLCACMSHSWLVVSYFNYYHVLLYFKEAYFKYKTFVYSHCFLKI